MFNRIVALALLSGTACSDPSEPGAAGGGVGAGLPVVGGGPPGGVGGGASDGGGGSSEPGLGGEASGELRAFPGAEGFGTETPGGRGGRVIVVDTLADDGPGSFREAMMVAEPRTIVFRVSGVIELQTSLLVGEASSYVTVAGQTSPGGITLRGEVAAYHDNFHDAVFRFVRFRGLDNYDNLTLNDVHHIVIDHCDFSGAEDETLDITYAQDVTVQWSTITNSELSGQNYGTLLAYPPTTNITMHHNLNAHHGGRCAPDMHWAGEVLESQIDFRNNVIYNCGFEVGYYSGNLEALLDINLVGNYFKAGPNTPGTAMMFAMPELSEAFADQNGGEGYVEFSQFSGHTPLKAPVPTPEVTTDDSATALANVLAKSGAWPRDAMNTRTVAEVQAGTGTLGKVDDALIESGPEAPADADLDGMPDDWETERGLAPADPNDAAGDDDDDGYTNLEEYLHQRAAGLIPG